MSARQFLRIFDTTLRDGEQSPGASMTRAEKLAIAHMLEKLRVDVIEAGFAASSADDCAAVQAVAEQIEDSRVCSLARALPADIDRAAQALAPAIERGNARIHTFIATSPVHMAHKLQMSPDKVLERAVAAVRHARRLCDDVEFSCEDASRSEYDFLCRVIEAAILAGATTINLPDTVGYAEPAEFGALVGKLLAAVPSAHRAVFSVHCHNDLGLAVANSLAALGAGASQIECTINGIGERAGNASLEEVVMAVATRSDRFALQSRIERRHLVPISRLVSETTGFYVQPNKAIVGRNAFAHEAGIHQDGIIKHRQTYEIMSAEDVGWFSNQLVLGKHSGRAALRRRMEDLGLCFEQPQFEGIFERFKELAVRQHEVFDEDLPALLGALPQEEADGSQLRELSYRSLPDGASAEVVVQIDGVERRAEGRGTGPVDAAFSALAVVTHSEASLLHYSLNAAPHGSASARGRATVRLAHDGHTANGTGIDEDVVTASARAWLDAQRRLGRAARRHPQLDGV